MNLTNYLVDARSVGDWGGQEHVVANNLNRIYRELDSRVYHLLMVGLEGYYDPGKYHSMMDEVWGHWENKKEVLINLTDKQIQEYIDDVSIKNTLIVCAQDVCSEYTLNELEMMARGVERMISEKD